jgi:uncharacterized protein with PQ loop repeat
MSHPHHHQSIRKRALNGKKPYPHQNVWINFLDKFIIALGVINIFATLPQVLQIWIGQDASGVSVISWSYYTFFSFMLFLYGLVHREKPIIITYSFSFILYGLIAFGALTYG